MRIDGRMDDLAGSRTGVQTQLVRRTDEPTGGRIDGQMGKCMGRRAKRTDTCINGREDACMNGREGQRRRYCWADT